MSHTGSGKLVFSFLVLEALTEATVGCTLLFGIVCAYLRMVSNNNW